MIKKVFDNAIPIVFAFDDIYFNYGYVSIKSLIKNTSDCRKYDICILHSGMNEYYQDLLKDLSQENISIRLFDISKFVKQYTECLSNGLTAGNQLTVTAFYRLWIPELFNEYEKCIYLDSDIIVRTDIAELYDIDLENKWIAGVLDMGIGSGLQKEITKYVKEKLNIENTFEYINSGILVMNIDILKNQNFLEKSMQTLKMLKTPLLEDQDVINVTCKGHIKFLDYEWNAQTVFYIPYAINWNISQWIEENKSLYEKLTTAIKNAKILHFVSRDKPWNCNSLRYSEYFWQVARQTPVYEKILTSNINKSAQIMAVEKENIRPLEYLFSLKNYKAHKIVRFCGLKLKIKRK